MPALCINPFHMSISIRGLDIFLANYLKDIETKIVLTYSSNVVNKVRDDGGEASNNDITNIVVKQEPGEQGIVAPHAILGTSSTHNRVWEPPITLEYDPQQACHTYFVPGGRAPYVQQSSSNAYVYVNKDAADNNYYDPKRAVLCLPPPPAQNVQTIEYAGPSEGHHLEICEDSNDEPLGKRSRDLSSHD
uniref:Uncharacterized protein n=1 Tax=Caenorhabditis japonica TaxID=281687 RepID=A0A8R1EKY2_CAEJA